MPNASSANNADDLAGLGFLLAIGVGLFLVASAFGSRRKGETITEEEAEEELAAIKEEEEQEPECEAYGVNHNGPVKPCHRCGKMMCDSHRTILVNLSIIHCFGRRCLIL